MRKLEERIKAMVCAKYGIALANLEDKHCQRLLASIKAIEEISYILRKDYEYNIKDIAVVLHRSNSSISKAILRYCLDNKLKLYNVKHKSSLRKHIVLLVDASGLRYRDASLLLTRTYKTGYMTGYRAAETKFKGNLRKSSFPGVPRVPPFENNAPTLIPEAVGGLLIEGETSEITASNRTKTRD